MNIFSIKVRLLFVLRFYYISAKCIGIIRFRHRYQSISITGPLGKGILSFRRPNFSKLPKGFVRWKRLNRPDRNREKGQFTGLTRSKSRRCWLCTGRIKALSSRLPSTSIRIMCRLRRISKQTHWLLVLMWDRCSKANRQRTRRWKNPFRGLLFVKSKRRWCASITGTKQTDSNHLSKINLLTTKY